MKGCSSGLPGLEEDKENLCWRIFLICIFGAEQPPSYSDRTAEPVCEGSTEVKVLHCMRQTASLSLGLMCICMCIKSASKCKMKRVKVSEVCSCCLNIIHAVHFYHFSKNSAQNAKKITVLRLSYSTLSWFFLKNVTQHDLPEDCVI